jgi:sugar/nucleoside kinase (ribokinase family)
VVLTTPGARTVLGTYRKLHADQAWNSPSEDDIRSSRIVCLDPFFGHESVRAARWCSGNGIPYVTIDDAPDSEIIRGADVAIISEEFAIRQLGLSDPDQVLAAYIDECAGLVIVTWGSEPLQFGRAHQRPAAFTPFAVEARDTTGAGDSFRAGIIYGMLNGYSDEQLVKTGCAVAALVCQGFPGVVNSPTEQALSAFLAERS